CSRYTHISLSLRSLSQVKLHKPSVRNTVSSRTAEGLPNDDFPHHANRPVRRAVIGEHPHCGEAVREAGPGTEIGGVPDTGGVGRRRMRLHTHVFAVRP